MGASRPDRSTRHSSSLRTNLEVESEVINLDWLNKETAVTRSARTALQTALGLVVAFFGMVWNVPGVPAAVHSFVVHHGQDLLSGGVATTVISAVVSFLYNYQRKDIPNT